VDGLSLWVNIEAGKKSADLVIPTVKDQVAEQAESVRFQADDDSGRPQPGAPVITGTVLDAS